jgi:putative ABC transport system permease protein
MGIVFGILTLLVTLAIGEGTRQRILRTVEAMGANLVYVSPEIVLLEEQKLDYTPLTVSECERLNQLQGVLAYAPTLNAASLIRLGKIEKVITIEGVTPSQQIVRDLSINKGRFVADEDVDQSSRVVVLGYDLAQAIHPDQNPLGQVLHLWGTSFKIVGVLERKGRTLGVDFDSQIFIPLTTLQEIQGKTGEIQGVWIRALDSNLTKDIMNQTRNLFSRKDLEIWNQEELLAKKDRISKVFKWALGAIALVSLLIGGIGVMNVLLVSVAERIKEIGIRKAVGASFLDILLQFIFESLLLALIGAFFGVVFGMVVGDYVAWILNALIPSAEKWEAVFSWGAIGVALHFTFWVGLIFGIYPAWKAARLDPCEALTCI